MKELGACSLPHSDMQEISPMMCPGPSDREESAKRLMAAFSVLGLKCSPSE